MTRTTATSPSQTALSESDLAKKALCDYVVNVADGCRHACAFCYVPSTPAIRCDPGGKFADHGIENASEDWGDYVLYREDAPENLRDDMRRHVKQNFSNWTNSRRGQGVVGISFGTDCYMDARAGKITGKVVEILTFRDDELVDTLEDGLGTDPDVLRANARPVRILTRNPKLAWDLHGDLYTELGREGLATVGTSIPSLNQDEVGAIEPGAPTIYQRLNGLSSFASYVPVFVSMSPTFPTLEAADLRKLLEEFRPYGPEVVFHEPINPRSSNFQKCIEAAHEAGEWRLQQAMEAITVRSAWREYAYEQLQTVQRLGHRLGIPVHAWPDDRLLADEDEEPTPDQAWAQAWRERPSPERIGFREPCIDGYPAVPTGSRQEELHAFEPGSDERLAELAPGGWQTVQEREERNDDRVIEEGE